MNLPGGWELILVLLVVVVVFGSKRLPDSARSLGRSMRILKAETKGLRDDDGTTTTTAQAGPVLTAPGVPLPDLTPPAVPFAGQQLYDAEGRPVQMPAYGAPAGRAAEPDPLTTPTRPSSQA